MNPLKWWRSIMKEIDDIEKRNEIMKWQALNIPKEMLYWIPVTKRLPDTKECNQFAGNSGFHRLFDCRVVKGKGCIVSGVEVLERRLYFASDGHWYEGWKLYDDYVTDWKCIAMPSQSDK